MLDSINVQFPSKPEIISNSNTEGEYVISNLYPGYGHTLGNVIRRIALSSIPGVAVSSLKIKGVPHEFSTIDGIFEDVLSVILNIKKINFKTNSDKFPIKVKINKKGKGKITAADIECPAQIEVANKDQHIAEITDDKTELQVEMELTAGIGYKSRDADRKNTEVGVIYLDCAYSPVKKSHYSVENMRVGDRTDFNRLSISIETNGTISPLEILYKSIEIIKLQCEAIGKVKLEEKKDSDIEKESELVARSMPIKDLDLSNHTKNALDNANIKTIGGLIKKGKSGISELPGIGEKSVEEIEKSITSHGIILKD